MSRADDIRAGAAAVEARIAAACVRAGRVREDVKLVAVSKTFPASDVEHVIAAGIADVGENKVQEARDKKPSVAGSSRWHLIGHLQSNKAKDAVRLFDVIQSVDSAELAEKIARAADSAGKQQEILLQVNIGRESQKSGASPDDVAELVRRIGALPSVKLSGLMAIPPAGEPEEVRPHFRALRAMRDDLGLTELSMGMTDDFEVAIEEGATIVRVGRAIFGSR
ncbi:MAG TPA: YggS family pyridoxal phosphate-dependent enzyme [Thermoanaerobaculia bacterium]|nr:YggS family pyridoxal phosphate-dependent enzyme [Thermoanaerobaculia bacterium]